MKLYKDHPGIVWGLIASMFIVLIAGFTSYFLLRRSAKKKQNEIIKNNKSNIEKEMKDPESGLNKIMEKSDLGELLWDLKEWSLKNKISIIADHIMQLSISTIIRNKFKNIYIPNSKMFYEISSFTQKTDGKVFVNKIDSDLKESIKKFKIKNVSEWDKTKFDFSIINSNEDNLIDKFKFLYKNINKNGIIIINNTNSKELKKVLKDLKKYINLAGYRHEIKKYENEVIVVAK